MNFTPNILFWLAGAAFAMGAGAALGVSIAHGAADAAIDVWDRIKPQPSFKLRIRTKGVDWTLLRARVHTALGYLLPIVAGVAACVVPAILDHKNELPDSLGWVVVACAIGQSAVHYYRAKTAA